ncbi:hypothetical protein C0995_013265 [Termitomyces sp. Mi166|nr:hypothetical protein C0995_013265 [Termitomyces sp. Mi166\
MFFMAFIMSRIDLENQTFNKTKYTFINHLQIVSQLFKTPLTGFRSQSAWKTTLPWPQLRDEDCLGRFDNVSCALENEKTVRLACNEAIPRPAGVRRKRTK